MASRLVRRFIFKIAYWALIVLLAGAAFFGATAAWSVYQKERVVYRELELAREHVDELTVRREALQETLDALETERGIEAEIRKRFPLAKEGEEVIVLLDAKPSSEVSREPEKKSLWQTLARWFSR